MVYVITGGPGFGKTTILNLLAQKGFPVCPESARSLIMIVKQTKGFVEFGSLPNDFEKIVAYKRVEFLSAIEDHIVAFSDRGIPDQIAYSKHKKKVPSNFILELATSNRYASVVFVTPPWKEIYTRDDIRQEEYEEAIEIHHQVVDTYLKFGYKIINLPLTNPEGRVKFILNFLGI